MSWASRQSFIRYNRLNIHISLSYIIYVYMYMCTSCTYLIHINTLLLLLPFFLGDSYLDFVKVGSETPQILPCSRFPPSVTMSSVATTNGWGDSRTARAVDGVALADMAGGGQQGSGGNAEKGECSYTLLITYTYIYVKRHAAS